MSIFGNDIRNAVIQIIDERIETAQEHYDTGIKDLKVIRDNEIEAVKLRHEQEKELLLKNCVASVLKA